MAARALFREARAGPSAGQFDEGKRAAARHGAQTAGRTGLARLRVPVGTAVSRTIRPHLQVDRTHGRGFFQIFASGPLIPAAGSFTIIVREPRKTVAMPQLDWLSLFAQARAGSAEALGQLLDSFRAYLWVIARN